MQHKLRKCLNCRSSHRRCSIEKVVLKNFAIFTGKHLRWSLFLIELQAQAQRPATVLKETLAKDFSVNITKILRTPIFKKTCKQLLLQFLLFTVNIFSQGLPSALNSKSLLSSRSPLRFKEFSLGCLVVDSSLIRQNEELTEMATRYHSLSLVVPLAVPFIVIRCHSLSFGVTHCTTRCHSLSLDVPLACLFINNQILSSLLNFINTVLLVALLNDM